MDKPYNLIFLIGLFMFINLFLFFTYLDSQKYQYTQRTALPYHADYGLQVIHS